MQAEENARDNGPKSTDRPKAEVKSGAEKRGPKTRAKNKKPRTSAGLSSSSTNRKQDLI
jgi:hypothetical protein